MEFDALRQRLRTATRLAVLTGAGISAESGVATFRSPGGLWTRFKPEELASMKAFMANTELVWEWYTHRREVVEGAQPNPGHLALVEMEQYFERVDIITQNVDGLHTRAGSTHVHELHGSLREHRCLDCGKPYGLRDDEEGVPHCPDCGGLIRPGVVWFGEMLPEDAWNASEKAAERCDVFLTVGTSALVVPAAYLPFTAISHGAYTLEINPESTDFTRYADLSLRGAAGVELPKLLEIIKQVKLLSSSCG
jgi:NAD-dependent deacetylase